MSLISNIFEIIEEMGKLEKSVIATFYKILIIYDNSDISNILLVNAVNRLSLTKILDEF